MPPWLTAATAALAACAVALITAGTRPASRSQLGMKSKKQTWLPIQVVRRAVIAAG
jgi:hypothetical protein